MIYDCIIIGGGPGGLTAGLYLARFYRKCLLFDDKRSRAALIPRSHNYPGFKNGISGKNILSRLRDQIKSYDIRIINKTVVELKYHKNKKIFEVKSQTKDSAKKIYLKSHLKSYLAKNVILATGLKDIEPPLPKLKNAIQNGLVRHCPICDAFEVSNQKVAILCDSNEAIKKAFFLKKYSKKITLFTLGKNLKINRKNCEIIKKFKIDVVQDPLIKVAVLKRKKIKMLHTSKGNYSFDTIYSALGAKNRSEAFLKMGIRIDKESNLLVSKKQETNIKGLYAVGDIVAGLNQIVVAMGQGAIAACAINNDLNEAEL